MDVLGISSLAAGVSAQKTAQVQTEAQVSLINKQGDQTAKVAGTIIESAGAPAPAQRPDKGNLITVA